MDKITGDIDSSENLEEPIDYKLYKVFWGFQRFFQTCNRAIESSAHWEALVRHDISIYIAYFHSHIWYRHSFEKLILCFRRLKEIHFHPQI